MPASADHFHCWRVIAAGSAAEKEEGAADMGCWRDVRGLAKKLKRAQRIGSHTLMSVSPRLPHA